MKRILDNLQVDVIAAAVMVAMVATGYILRFPLPPGTNKTSILWGLTRHQWGTVHFWISIALLVLVVVHVCLHWQWVLVSVKRRLLGTSSPSKSPLVSGLLTVFVLAAVLSLFGWAAHSSVRTITEPIEGVCPPSEPPSELAAVESDQASPITEHGTVAFWRDVYPVFEKSCLSCHGSKKQLGGFRVDRKEDFFEGTTPFVVPGNSEDSPLVAILSGEKKDMARADVHRLDKKELAVVSGWIDAGAEWPARPTD